MKQKSTFLLGTLLSLLISLPTNAQPEPQSVLQIRSGNLLPTEFISAKKVGQTIFFLCLRLRCLRHKRKAQCRPTINLIHNTYL